MQSSVAQGVSKPANLSLSFVVLPFAAGSGRVYFAVLAVPAYGVVGNPIPLNSDFRRTGAMLMWHFATNSMAVDGVKYAYG
ncbi:MAG TPA: hypothetical protein VIC26_00565 [Marinagarivorans sp.]